MQSTRHVTAPTGCHMTSTRRITYKVSATYLQTISHRTAWTSPHVNHHQKLNTSDHSNYNPPVTAEHYSAVTGPSASSCTRLTIYIVSVWQIQPTSFVRRHLTLQKQLNRSDLPTQCQHRTYNQPVTTRDVTVHQKQKATD